MKPATHTQDPLGAPVPGRWDHRQWGLLSVLAGNMLIDALEVSAMVVAVPAAGRDLGLSLTGAQWLITGFAVGFGGLTLFGGRLVELLGRRRVYLWALLGFAVASLVGGVTDEPAVLVAARVLKGCFAALTAPTGLAIIAAAFPAGPERDRAVSVYALFGGFGFTAGLLLSGLLTTVGWRWTFVFPAPVVLVLFAFALRLVPGDASDPGAKRHLDVTGALALTGVLLCLVQGIVSVPGHGWLDLRTAGPLGLAVVLGAVLVAAERTAPRPLIRWRLLRNRTLVRSMTGAAALNGVNLGLLLLMTAWLQDGLGWSPWRTALGFLPAAAPLALTALPSRKLIARYGTARPIALGAAAAAAAGALCLRHPVPQSYVTDVLPTMLLLGAAFVLSFVALNTQATSRLAAVDRSAAVGLYQSAVQVSAVVVPAVAAALAVGRSDDRPALWFVTAVALAGLAAGLDGLRTRPARAENPLTGE
ncbi:MFS transporter [Streptomyces sp. NPDC047081]|uniref:MFS transporter n=1 Tax=Streptomyces sp. NPDC047081 TaxID=3154706 RepID=UPI00340683DA